MEKTERIGSVDILRGVVMFTMIFVNCGFYKSPWWSRHYESGGDGMTYVDVIFPAFLFLAGVSVPLALERYRDTLRNGVRALGHVFYRAATLMVMGVLYVNNSYGSDMGFSFNFWFSAVLLIIVLVWQQYKGDSAAGKIISGSLRVLGVAALVWFYFHYQGAQAVDPVFGTRLRPSWWGILGLIGRAYLIAALVYLAIGRRTELLMFAALLVSMAHVVSFGGGLNEWWYLAGGDRLMITAGQGSISMLGAVAGAKILQLRGMEAKLRHREFLWFLGWFALISFATAAVLRKLYGLHKDSTFPAYVYASIAWTVLAWWLIYWLCDVRKIDNKVTRFFNRVGGIALSAYVMSSLLRCLASLAPVSEGGNLFYWLFSSLAPWLETLGAPLWCVQMAGASQTVLFALAVCGICLWFKKRKILLKI